jgi:hypothetical protein
MSQTGAKCARAIFFKAREGKSAEYGDYLRATVEPIDRRAIAEGALLDMLTLVNDADPSQPWSHLRIFLFESEAQRAAIQSVFARIAPQLQPDAALRAARKAHGESLRSRVAEVDADLLG